MSAPGEPAVGGAREDQQEQSVSFENKRRGVLLAAPFRTAPQDRLQRVEKIPSQHTVAQRPSLVKIRTHPTRPSPTPVLLLAALLWLAGPLAIAITDQGGGTPRVLRACHSPRRAYHFNARRRQLERHVALPGALRGKERGLFAPSHSENSEFYKEQLAVGIGELGGRTTCG